MRREMLIRVLEVLEKEAPSSLATQDISNKIGMKFEPQGELLQIVNYLIDSNRVHLMYKNYLPVMMNGAESLKILPSGIDLLTELKTLHQKERLEKHQHNLTLSVSAATVVLALAALVDGGISLVLNKKGLIAELGGFWFSCLMILFFIIFCFMAFLAWKSYYVLQSIKSKP